MRLPTQYFTAQTEPDGMQICKIIEEALGPQEGTQSVIREELQVCAAGPEGGRVGLSCWKPVKTEWVQYYSPTVDRRT